MTWRKYIPDKYFSKIQKESQCRDNLNINSVRFISQCQYHKIHNMICHCNFFHGGGRNCRYCSTDIILCMISAVNTGALFLTVFVFFSKLMQLQYYLNNNIILTIGSLYRPPTKSNTSFSLLLKKKHNLVPELCRGNPNNLKFGIT